MKSLSLSGKSVPDGKVHSRTHPVRVEMVVTHPSARAVFGAALQEYVDFQVLESFDQSAPQMTILEIDADSQRALETIRSLQSVRPVRDIFLTGAPPDSTVLLEALRAGVKEFFPYPVDHQTVSQALRRYVESRVSPEFKEGPAAGRVVSVMGSSGGLGTTSLAVNLAVSIQAQDPDKSVVLVEVDQQSGNLPVYLDLTPSYSFQDITKDFPRLDDALVKKFLIDHESGIQVLPSGYDDLHAGRLDAFGVKETVALLSSLFDYVVIDVGHTLEAPSLEALSLSNLILLVSTLQVPVIHRTEGLLQALTQQGIEGLIELVVNRYRDDEAGLIEETVSVLQHRVAWRLPEDGISARQAINQGAPCVLSHPKSSLAKSYIGLAKSVSGNAVMSVGNTKSMGHIQKLIQYGRAKLHLAQAS